MCATDRRLERATSALVTWAARPAIPPGNSTRRRFIGATIDELPTGPHPSTSARPNGADESPVVTTLRCRSHPYKIGSRTVAYSCTARVDTCFIGFRKEDRRALPQTEPLRVPE